MKLYDLIIIGGGPAGLTAAVYAARKMMKTLLVSENIGGQPLKSSAIENYLGYSYISGIELVAKFTEHVEKFSIEKELAKVNKVTKLNNDFKVIAKDKTFKGKTVIIASGKSPRYLNVPGEKEFFGRGVTYCATCDAPLFSGMDVAVIGGGNAALDAASQLALIASKVHIISLSSWTGDPITQKKIKEFKNVHPWIGYQTLQIEGDKFVQGIVIEKIESGEKKKIPLQGIFVEIGSIPNSQIVEGLVELNEQKEIIVNCKCETNVPGLFAAGDVTNVPEKQIIIAAGEGAKAVLSASKYLLET